jgi:hypothetical protein
MDIRRPSSPFSSPEARQEVPAVILERKKPPPGPDGRQWASQKLQKNIAQLNSGGTRPIVAGSDRIMDTGKNSMSVGFSLLLHPSAPGVDVNGPATFKSFIAEIHP